MGTLGSSTGMAGASVLSSPGARVRSSMALANRLEDVDRRADSASERLRRDVDPRAREARALPLGGHVLDVLVRDGFDEDRVTEFAAVDDLPGRRRAHDRVVVRASYRPFG
jgi:hypothetical protein